MDMPDDAISPEQVGEYDLMVEAINDLSTGGPAADRMTGKRAPNNQTAPTYVGAVSALGRWAARPGGFENRPANET